MLHISRCALRQTLKYKPHGKTCVSFHQKLFTKITLVPSDDLLKVIRGHHLALTLPPCIDHIELLAWMQKADFSEHIQRFKLHEISQHVDATNTKFAPTGYRRAPNIISHHHKQQLSAKASIIPKARPIRFR